MAYQVPGEICGPTVRSHLVHPVCRGWRLDAAARTALRRSIRSCCKRGSVKNGIAQSHRGSVAPLLQLIVALAVSRHDNCHGLTNANRG